MKTQVFAFAPIDSKSAMCGVLGEIHFGKSLCAMSDQTKSLREEWHDENTFLLEVREGDWIVHVNMPIYGRCVAVQASGEYGFDEGIECK